MCCVWTCNEIKVRMINHHSIKLYLKKKITHLLLLALLLVPRTHNNTDGNKLVIFFTILLYNGDTCIIIYYSNIQQTPALAGTTLETKYSEVYIPTHVPVHSPTRISLRIFCICLLSRSTVMRPSSVANWLSSPNRKSMKKNKMAQNGAPGMRRRASPTITNARPGPWNTYVC